MVPTGFALDYTSVASVLSTAFALSIAIESYTVFRRTEREHFLAFTIGFVLLAASFALLIPLAFGINLPTIGYETSDILAYPPRIVISSLGFIIIALSYTPTQRVRQVLYGLIALLVFLVALVLFPYAPSVPSSIDSLLFLLHTALLIYIVYRIWQVARPTGLATSAFLILLVSQFIAFVGTLNPDQLTLMIGETARLVSFFLFFTALAIAIRPKVAPQPTRTKLR